MQEVFAGFMTHTDYHLGRLFAGIAGSGNWTTPSSWCARTTVPVRRAARIGSVNEHRFAHGHGDNLADNLAGIDELGGFRSYNHYPWGWAWAGNTPFKLWKRYTWLGGTRTPLVVRWPGGIDDAGGVRSQFCHITDLFPTILEACGVEPPATVDGVQQQRIDGESLIPTFADPAAAEVRTTQYFEMLGSRSIYHDGWMATTDHVSQGVPDESLLDGSRDLDADRWSLFRLDDDFAQTTDLAADHPDLLHTLEQLWWTEAEANKVLPIDDGLRSRMAAMERPLWPTPPHVVYRPGGSPIADEALPSLAAGTALSADVDVPDGGGEGVLCALGDWTSGWAFVVLAGRPCFLINLSGNVHRVASDELLAAGRHRVGFRFIADGAGGGTGIITVDDHVSAAAVLPRGMAGAGMQIGGGGLRLGHDAGFPVTDDYAIPFRVDRRAAFRHVRRRRAVARPT